MPRSDVVIFDGLNLFIRAFVAVPSLNASGSPNGAVFGGLKSIQKVVHKFEPKFVFIVWDGANGSRRRRQLFGEYKEGRKPAKLNRNVDQHFSDDETQANKMEQFIRLIEYLNNLPFIQFMIDDVEADDVIARIAKSSLLKGRKKFIVSSDKDFIQLVNDEVFLYRPIQDKVYEVKDVVEEFGIHPNNFALARAIAGDVSDNLDGVPGVGLKTIAKRFPDFANEKDLIFKDLLQEISAVKKPLKVHLSIQENVQIVERNQQLMDLSIPRISPINGQKIKQTMETFLPSFNKIEIIKMLATDGIQQFHWTNLFFHSKFIVEQWNEKF